MSLKLKIGMMIILKYNIKEFDLINDNILVHNKYKKELIKSDSFISDNIIFEFCSSECKISLNVFCLFF